MSNSKSMKNDCLNHKTAWLKYPLLCLLICPLSAIAGNNPVDLPNGLMVVLQKGDTRTITGTVIDDGDKSPIIGASIMIKGTSTGVITDLDGQFSVTISGRRATLEVSYMGYKKQLIDITDQGVLNIRMVSDNEMLGEVIVVGAGTQKKVSVTGAITSVKGSLLTAPSSSLTSNIAGKLAGIISKVNSGEPGSTSEFYIRGVGTFGGRATPLILMDGVEITTGDLDRLPTETIESFSILKDTSATAIYGARGANGVMLVTTKSGQENQRSQINVNVEYSIQQPMSQNEYVDGATWMELYNEALVTRNPGKEKKYTQDVIEMTRNQAAPFRYPDVDWMDLMFKDMTMNQRANVNLSGGGSKVTYYMSLQANHDTGMLNVPKTYSYDNNINRWNYTFQNNITYKLTPTTKVGLRMNAQIGNAQGPDYGIGDLFKMAREVNPIAFPATFPASADDTHIMFGNAYLTSSELYKNPYASMLGSFKEENYNTLNTSLNLEQNLDMVTKGLKVTALINFKNWSTVWYKRSIDPYYYRIDETTWGGANDPNTFELQRLGSSGTDYINQSDASRNSNNTFYIDARLDYNRTFGNHSVSGMLMYMQRESREGVLPNRNQGVSGRFTYDYGHRYLAEVNFGYNGTERLQKGDRFEFFPAMSLGWVASGEKFWKPIEKYVNYFKVRGSYGVVGSDDTGGSNSAHYLYVNQVILQGGGYHTGVLGDVEKKGPGFNAYAVDGACWERVNKLDIGVDMELFNQLSITFDYFYDHRYKILLRRGTWPTTMGYFGATPWSNIGEVDNRGVEFSLNWRKEVIKDLIVDFRTNFTYNKNKYVKMDDPEYPYVWQTQTGKPLSRTDGYIAEGLFGSQDEIDNSPVQDNLGSRVKPGDIKYRDVNGDGAITDEDKVMLSPYGSMPRIQYGMGLNMTYKKIDLGMFFNGSAQRTIMVSGITPFGGQNNNVMKFISEDYWSEANPNPNAAYPRLGVTGTDVDNNMVNSSFWMHNGNFIRFKTLEVGYSFPYCRVYLSGDNLAVWSPFKLWDPELSWDAYPLQRTFNIGVQLKF